MGLVNGSTSSYSAALETLLHNCGKFKASRGWSMRSLRPNEIKITQVLQGIVECMRLNMHYLHTYLNRCKVIGRPLSRIIIIQHLYIYIYIIIHLYSMLYEHSKALYIRIQQIKNQIKHGKPMSVHEWTWLQQAASPIVNPVTRDRDKISYQIQTELSIWLGTTELLETFGNNYFVRLKQHSIHLGMLWFVYSSIFFVKLNNFLVEKPWKSCSCKYSPPL